MNHSLPDCKACRGTGWTKCPRCGGRGMDREHAHRHSDSHALPCRQCRGGGAVRCADCHGASHVVLPPVPRVSTVFASAP